MTRPSIPAEPPEPGDVVFVRYHKSDGTDGAAAGEVTGVGTSPGGYTITVDKDGFEDVKVDMATLAVATTWPPDEDGTRRLGVLKALGDAPDGELPLVDQHVDRFKRYSTLTCGECGDGRAKVVDGDLTCSGCGAAIDMDAAEARREQNR